MGLWRGLAYAALDTYALRGKTWTLHVLHPDHETLLPADAARVSNIPSPTAC
jgi:hypothetical protein